MRVLVTRPLNEASAWVTALTAAGHEAIALPLIDIGPVKDQAAVLNAWQAVSSCQAIMFVSAAAVKYFFAAVQQGATDHVASTPSTASIGHHLGRTRCWATGLGTRKALLQIGVPDALIDAPSADAGQFDSEALWRVVAPKLVPSQAVLIVRGTDDLAPKQEHPAANPQGVGRDWLAQTLHKAGVPVRWAVSYKRALPLWSEAQRHLAQTASADGSVWCFSSSQAISFLQRLLPQQTWSSARCIVTHPRIAEAARALGFGHISLSRPLIDEVVGSLESMA